ncbi:MAG: HAD hydrolase family protein [Bacteroidota bacterium]
MISFKERLSKITTILFDVDGVLTDGKVLIMESGEMVRNMNSKDGYALHLAVSKGYRIAVISGGNNVAVKNALERTGIQDVFIKEHDKLSRYEAYKVMHGIKDEEMVFVGDDLPDHEIMSKVGLAVCPNDAAMEIKLISHYVSPKNGGEGCIRDIIEQILKVQGNWEIVKW